MLLALESLKLDSVGVGDGTGLRHHLGEVEVIEFIHEVFAIGEVEFEGELSFEVGGEVDMLQGLVCRGDRIVYQRNYLVELFILLLLDSISSISYLNSGILDCLAVVFLRTWAACLSFPGDFAGTGLIKFSEGLCLDGGTWSATWSGWACTSLGSSF